MDRPADTTLYRALHRAMLASVTRLLAALPATVDAPPRPRKALARWSAGLTATIRWHHREEEHHAFPALAAMSPAGAPVIARLAADHRALNPLLDQVDADIARLTDDRRSMAAASARAVA